MGDYLDFIKHDFRNITSNPKIALQMALTIRTRAQKYLLFHEIFIQQPYHWLVERLKPNTTVLDIGANIGDTPVYFSMFPTVKKVVAYEPVLKTYLEGKANINQSPYKTR